MSWEGCRLTAYRCPAGVLTIGFGHTGPDVKAGQTITQAEADRLFNDDINRFARTVEAALQGLKLTQNQFDALVSLSYNIGSLTVKAPTLLRLIREGAPETQIRAEFLKHANARVGGVLKLLPGLLRRREAEADHFFAR